MRYFVTGTDTDVGKTRVCAALARACVERGERPTIVKLVQTGLDPGVPGDAAVAAGLAGCDGREFARFARPADPWSAALAEGARAPDAATLVARLDDFADPLIVEGSGGIAVPLDATQTLGDVAALARCVAIVVVALRLGCINHTILTLEYLAARRVVTRGIVFVERDGPTDDAYRADVARALAGRTRIIATMPYDDDAARSIARATPMFADLRRADAGS